MSGNTLTLGLRTGLGDFLLALNSITAVFGYIVGVALGANIGYQSSISNKIWSYVVTKILAVEFLMIILFTSVEFISGNSGSNVVYLLILLASISMGMQSTAVRGLGISGVTSTYVTGTWTSFIRGLVSDAHIHRKEQSRRSKIQLSKLSPWLLISLGRLQKEWW